MTCRHCPHGATAHEHYRAGTDCALCDCPRLRRQRWWNLASRAATPAPVGPSLIAPQEIPVSLGG